jgi:DNA topoisomerase-1
MTTPRRTILMIVESKKKAKLIQGFLADLPDRYVVLPCVGHVADIPKSRKGAIDMERGYEPNYQVTKDAREVVDGLVSALKDVDMVVLGTDADREGEMIAQTLLDLVVAPNRPDLVHGMVHRVTFNAVSEEAVKHGLAHPRGIDERLVEAAKARRVIDRLFGYDLIAVARGAVTGAARGGRVQSPALQMVVARERERLAFVRAPYWAVRSALVGVPGAVARLVRLDGRDLAMGTDHFDGANVLGGRHVLTGEEAQRVVEGATTLHVTKVDERAETRRRPDPYRYVTFVNDAMNRLGMSMEQVNTIGQALVDGGHITYMRSDSERLEPATQAAIRRQVEETWGAGALGAPAANGKTKGDATVQDAHEAVTPVRIKEARPAGVEGRALDLYTMVRERTLASQMTDASGSSVSIVLSSAGGAEFKVAGTVFDDPGFLRAYSDRAGTDAQVDVDAGDDGGSGADDIGGALGRLPIGSAVEVAFDEPYERTTRPPARYTEASLTMALDREKIGRPSTMRTIIKKLREHCVWGTGRELVPRLSSFVMDRFLTAHFGSFVDLHYTANLEHELDGIQKGVLTRAEVVRAMYEGDAAAGRTGFRDAAAEAREAIEQAKGRGDRSGWIVHDLGTHPRTGEQVLLYGGATKSGGARPYLSAGGRTASVTDETRLESLTLERAVALLDFEPRDLGTDPASGNAVKVLSGQYGIYLQLGERAEGRPSPLTCALPPGTSGDTVDMETALEALRLRRTVLGLHPDSGEEVAICRSTRNEKISWYVQCGDETRSVKVDAESVTLDAALALLAVPKPVRRARSAGGKRATIPR